MPTLTAPPSVEELLGPGGALEALLPGYEYREQQIDACRAIEEAFESERHCLVEAGTGVGKTLAYLIPAARAIAQKRKVVISTHTINLQNQLIQKDIPLVARLLPEIGIRAALMKGRGNYLCLQDLDAAEADLFIATDPQFKRLKSWAKKTQTGDAADLPFVFGNWWEVAANIDTCRRQECRYYERCHYYRMRRRAMDANLFVVNHALFLSDLAIRREDPESTILPAYDFVIFDEAHHLEDIATKVFGIELSNRRIPHLVDRIRRTRDLDIEPARLEALEMVNSELFGAFQTTRKEFFFQDVLEETSESAYREATTRLCVGLQEVNKKLLEAAKDSVESVRDRLEGLAKAGARLRTEIETLAFHEDEDFVRWGAHSQVEIQNEKRKTKRQAPRTTLHYSPVAVGKILETALWDSIDSVVLTSATLSNSGGFSYLRSRLNVPEDALERVVGSPFDFRSQAMLYVPGDMPSPKACAESDLVELYSNEIERVVSLTGGRAFLLFTSWRVMKEVYDRLYGKLPYPLYRQGDMPPSKLLEAFRMSGNGCLFGTQTFWEGVDVQGEALSCVIIDRLPFAVPDSPITRARTDAIKAAGGDWFAEFSVPQAQIRLKQGFGRLIRTKTDRGIVCVLDSRLIHANYGKEFVRYLPPAARASLWPRIERFWLNPDSANSSLAVVKDS